MRLWYKLLRVLHSRWIIIVLVHRICVRLLFSCTYKPNTHNITKKNTILVARAAVVAPVTSDGHCSTPPKKFNRWICRGGRWKRIMHWITMNVIWGVFLTIVFLESFLRVQLVAQIFGEYKKRSFYSLTRYFILGNHWANGTTKGLRINEKILYLMIFLTMRIWGKTAQ